MPWVVPVIIAAGSIYGGISGAAKQKAMQEAAQKAMAQAAAQYDGIIPPDVRALIVEELHKQGIYTPEMEQSIAAGESNYKAITENKETVAAQEAALQQMIGVSRTGLQASDRAALNKVRNEVARDVEGKQQQILQQMQARGMGGSGAELAMQIANSQAGADRASEEADRLAAQAQQNALKALGDSSNMASQARGDDFRLSSAKAQAADEMQRFNVSNQREVAQRNVQSSNAAQAANLQESQRIYEQNIANRRAEAERMEAAKQQKFSNEMRKADALTGIYTGQAKQNVENGKDQAAGAQSMGSGLGQMGGSIAKAAIPARQNNSIDPSTGRDRAGGTTGYSGDYLNMAHGGVVPGTPVVQGDSPVNDIIPANLSPGEVVVPRSVVAEPSKVPGFLKKAKASAPKEPKEDKGPSDAELAKHVISSNALLHSLMSRLNKKAD